MIQKTTWFQLRPLYEYLRQQAENKKFLKYFEIGATFSLIAIFLLLAIQPTASAISVLVGEINSKELSVKNMKSKINNVLKAQDSYAQVQEKYSIIDSNFPENPKFYQAASNFSAISDQSSNSLTQINFSLIDNPDNLVTSNFGKSFGVELNGTGQYSSILDMIQKIISSRRLTDIKSIQISKVISKNNNNSSGAINFNISSNLFYSPLSNEKK